MEAAKSTARQDEHFPFQRGTHTGWISQQGCVAMLGCALRDHKHPQVPSTGWMKSKNERQPAADLIHKGITCLPEPKAKSTSRRVGLRQTEEIKSYS